MKQVYFLMAFLGVIAMFGCNKNEGDRGELIGVVPKKTFKADIPLGMVYIPGGSFLMGQTDQDVTFSQISQTQQVTVAPFFMDQTEITNSQYKKFVNWVIDSIAISSYLNDPKYFIEPAKGAASNSNGKKVY